MNPSLISCWQKKVLITKNVRKIKFGKIKTFVQKKIFDPKKFLLRTIVFGTKWNDFWYEKIFRYEIIIRNINIFGPKKKVGLKKILSKKVFCLKEICLSKKKFCQKNLVQKTYGPKKMWSKRIFSSEKNFCQIFSIWKRDILGPKKFWSKKKFGEIQLNLWPFAPNNIFVQKMFCPKKIC